MNEITIDKVKFLKLLEFNFYGNTLADIEKKLNECKLPDDWKLWSEDKPAAGFEIEFKTVFIKKYDIVGRCVFSTRTIYWRHVNE